MHKLTRLTVNTRIIQSSIVRLFHTNNPFRTNATPVPPTNTPPATPKIPKLNEKIEIPPELEIPKAPPGYTEKDISNMEKILEDYVNKGDEKEDSGIKPKDTVNAILIAILLVLGVVYKRSDMILDATKELLVNTKNEMGTEIERLRSSREEILSKIENANECDAKCKEYTTRLRAEIKEQDLLNAYQVVNDIPKPPQPIAIQKNSRMV